MKKRLLLKLGLVAILGTGLFVAWWYFIGPNHNITNEGVARLKEGMTRAEIETILRLPPGDYGPGKAIEGPFHWDANIKHWKAGSIAIRVRFNEQGIADWIESDPVARIEESWIDFVRHKVGLD